MDRVLLRLFLGFLLVLVVGGACAGVIARSEARRVVKTMEHSTSGATPRAASVAPDQQFAIGGAAMQSAETVAQSYWDAQPCGGDVSIKWTDQAPDTNAVSSWVNPSSAYDNPTQNFNCEVDFNRDIGFDWARFCTVLVHEFGHLTGHAHSPDPSDVMAAYYTRPLAQCVSTSDPTAPAAAPVPVAAAAPSVQAQAPAPSLNAVAAAAAQPRAEAARAKPARKRTVRHHARRHPRRHPHHVARPHRHHPRPHGTIPSARSSQTVCAPGSTDANYCESLAPAPKPRRKSTTRRVAGR